MTQVLDQARKITIPTKQEEEKMKTLSDFLLKLVKDEVTKHAEVVSVELGGSYAKVTWLRGQMDLDIFVKIKKEGFGGYVAEVLVHHYGSFANVLEAAANFTPGQIIGNPTKKFETNLILIDPIDSNRNLGTAISTQNIGRFMLSARAFLKKPLLVFFTGTKLIPNTKNLKNTIIVKFNYKWRSPDIIWGQAKRGATALSGQLELAGFQVLRKSVITDEKSEAAMLFLLRSPVIEKFMVKNGPQIYRRSDSDNFIAANSKNM